MAVEIGQESPDINPSLFLEYWTLPDETSKLKHDGWFFTGDFARYDNDGDMWILGRKDDIIKVLVFASHPMKLSVSLSHTQQLQIVQQ